MEYDIRKVENTDVDSLNLLFQKLLEFERENYDKNIKEDLNINSYFDKKIEESDNILFVAELDNKIIGYIYGFVDRTNKIKKELECVIASIYIEEDYRNIGIGTKLINTFINKIKEEKVKYVYIDNLIDNNVARKLYSKLGFDIFKETRKMKLGD